MQTRKSHSVLIADTAQDARDLIKEAVLTVTLKALVVEANDAAKAEFKVANQAFDLVILAMRLPGKGGIKLLNSFMNMNMRPKSVILLTEGPFDTNWNTLFQPLYHIQKPFEADSLKAIIVSALSKI